mmetsp:Transcript_32298/g.36633  ORF Transcript_32298/g.36633 Transcript_32298/m.36633 type:complete len:504 (-) Transcript_32298:45-1556(-)
MDLHQNSAGLSKFVEGTAVATGNQDVTNLATNLNSKMTAEQKRELLMKAARLRSLGALSNNPADINKRIVSLNQYSSAVDSWLSNNLGVDLDLAHQLDVGEEEVFLGNPLPIKVIALDQKGTKLASGGWDNIIRIWELENSVLCAQLKGHNDCILSLVLDSTAENVVSASADKTIKVWNIKDQKNIETLNHHPELVKKMIISEDGKTLYTASIDGTISLVDTGNWTYLRMINTGKRNLQDFCLHPDGTQIVVGYRDRTVSLYNSETAKWIKSFEVTGGGSLTSVLLIDDSRTVIVGFHKGELTSWDIETTKKLQTFEGHTDGITSIASSKKGLFFVSASLDSTARVWDCKLGVSALTIDFHTDPVQSVQMSSDGKFVFTAGFDKLIKKTPMGVLNIVDRQIEDPEVMDGITDTLRHVQDTKGMVTAQIGMLSKTMQDQIQSQGEIYMKEFTGEVQKLQVKQEEVVELVKRLQEENSQLREELKSRDQRIDDLEERFRALESKL